jgi:hypothetical protein
MPHSRGLCSCGSRVGRHAFVTRDGRALECGRCATTRLRDEDSGEPRSNIRRKIRRLSEDIEKAKEQHHGQR